MLMELLVGLFLATSVIVGEGIIVCFSLKNMRKDLPEVRMVYLLDSHDKELYDQELLHKQRQLKKGVFILFLWFFPVIWGVIILPYLWVEYHVWWLQYVVGFSTHEIFSINVLSLLVMTYFSLSMLWLLIVLYRYWPITHGPWIPLLAQNGIDVSAFVSRKNGAKFWEIYYKRKRLYILIRSYIKTKYPEKTSYHFLDEKGATRDFVIMDPKQLNRSYSTNPFKPSLHSHLVSDLQRSGLINPDRRFKLWFVLAVVFLLAFCGFIQQSINQF